MIDTYVLDCDTTLNPSDIFTEISKKVHTGTDSEFEGGNWKEVILQADG